MKVLNLRCAMGHTFEGWFASEEQYVAQRQAKELTCPLCADEDIHKVPSAPRLNLSTSQPRKSSSIRGEEPSDIVATALSPQAHWLRAAREVMARTEDVGNRFPEEARRMHYGESPERGIRGLASPDETRSLLDEGIAVAPLVLPDALKQTLQ